MPTTKETPLEDTETSITVMQNVRYSVLPPSNVDSHKTSFKEHTSLNIKDLEQDADSPKISSEEHTYLNRKDLVDLEHDDKSTNNEIQIDDTNEVDPVNITDDTETDSLGASACMDTDDLTEDTSIKPDEINEPKDLEHTNDKLDGGNDPEDNDSNSEGKTENIDNQIKRKLDDVSSEYENTAKRTPVNEFFYFSIVDEIQVKNKLSTPVLYSASKILSDNATCIAIRITQVEYSWHVTFPKPQYRVRIRCWVLTRVRKYFGVSRFSQSVIGSVIDHRHGEHVGMGVKFRFCNESSVI